MFHLFSSRSRPRNRVHDGEAEAARLLGRRQVHLDTPQLQSLLSGASVLVTGAGGSIGSEICRQVMRFAPGRLTLVERAENALFEIDRELREQWNQIEIYPCIADICDQARIEQVFDIHRPQVVFHCAAHKHVPMMEINAAEAVWNNVFGTRVVADASLAAGVQAFVLISTDKAVNPTSVMGAAKRCAELYVQSVGRRGSTGLRRDDDDADEAPLTLPGRFLSVRFGNVLGSSGSVVPIFSRQIDAGGPVTVTHPDMQRYFMTIPEAAQLVMQAGAIGRGGEIFVLDMGKPVRIVDLARAMIRQRGLRPGRDIRIAFTGIRPGEKLYEELSFKNETMAATSHPGIHIWKLPPPDPSQLERMMRILEATHNQPPEQVRAALAAIVPEYAPTDSSNASLEQAA